ncbi:hypothetical protein GCM10020295_34110 [Streptomyces cinereospinus]
MYLRKQRYGIDLAGRAGPPCRPPPRMLTRGWGTAIGLLAGRDVAELDAPAVTPSRLPGDAAVEVDANVMVTHSQVGVRQAGAVLCLRHPPRYREQFRVWPRTASTESGTHWQKQRLRLIPKCPNART